MVHQHIGNFCIRLSVITISLQRLGASLRYEIPNNSENPGFSAC